MSMGRSSPLALHPFWHSSAVGHSTPQAPARGLLRLTVAAAPLRFLRRIWRMNLPGSVPAGQSALHGGSWHSRQRAASAMAWSMV